MVSVIYNINTIGVCTEGEVRLTGLTASDLQGNVEICHDNVWGGVCDDRWWNPDARVVCRQLGYSGTDSNYIGIAAERSIFGLTAGMFVCNSFFITVIFF